MTDKNLKFSFLINLYINGKTGSKSDDITTEIEKKKTKKKTEIER